MRTDSSRSSEALIAWAFAGLFHVVVLWVVSRPILIQPGNIGLPLQVVFIQRPRAKQPPVAKTGMARVAPASRRKAATVARSEPLFDEVDRAAPQHSATPVVGDDAWDRPAAKRADGITFVRNPLASTFNPRPMPRPGRFRMRREVTPEDIVRGASQVLGFWPPGYTDDPCVSLEKAIEMLMSTRTRREQSLLVDAVREREKYCE